MTSLHQGMFSKLKTTEEPGKGPRVDLSQLFWEDQDEDSTAKPGATAVLGREARRMGPRRKLIQFEMTLSKVWLQSVVPGIAI